MFLEVRTFICWTSEIPEQKIVKPTRLATEVLFVGTSWYVFSNFFLLRSYCVVIIILIMIIAIMVMIMIMMIQGQGPRPGPNKKERRPRPGPAMMTT